MTGIRGIAALWVMLFHAQVIVGKFFPILQRPRIFHKGYHGVDLFFMLSGFILMYTHGHEFFRLRKVPLIRFARLRFTRVYPLSTVVSLLIGVLVILQPGFVAWQRSTFQEPFDYSLGSFIRTLFLATRWFLPGKGEWNSTVWSLSLELLGYAVFPVLAFCTLRIAQKWLLAGVVVLSLLGCIVVLYMTNTPPYGVDQMAVTRMVASFVTGIAIFRMWELTGEAAKKWAGGITVCSAAGIVIACQVDHFGGSLNFLFALLLFGLAFQRGVVDRLLSSRALVYLGKISFPLYLIHVVPVLWLRYFYLSGGAGYSARWKIVGIVCWFVGSLMLASLLHILVEKPSHAWGRRWAGEQAPQQEAAATVS